ncbi:MAG: hypothetical protein ACI8WB_003482 [Phenylobacterium sp.]|jgi:hypothetical protein
MSNSASLSTSSAQFRLPYYYHQVGFGRQTQAIDAESMDKITTFCQQHQLTPLAMLISASGVFFGRALDCAAEQTGQTDFTIGLNFSVSWSRLLP